jgi:hypothetical protein
MRAPVDPRLKQANRRTAAILFALATAIYLGFIFLHA